MSGDASPDGVSGPPEIRLTVAAVARRLGVAPATLRTWDRRYGLGPTLHVAGAHRRYSRADVGRLEAMRRLVLDGVPPSDAARIAVDQAAAGEGAPAAGRPGSGAGGRVLALPGAPADVRGLARAAMALDATAVRTALERAVHELGVVSFWEDVLCPVLVTIGERWEATGDGVEVEHLLAETAGGVLRGMTDAPEPPNGRPVLLACSPGELHSLPLSALAAALSERGIGVRLLGASVPARALVAAVRRTGPAALLVWAHQEEYADVEVLDLLPRLRPPVAVLAGGLGWAGRALPTRVAYATDLTAALGLIGRVVGA